MCRPAAGGAGNRVTAQGVRRTGAVAGRAAHRGGARAGAGGCRYDRLDQPGAWPLDLGGLGGRPRHRRRVGGRAGWVKRPGPPVELRRDAHRRGSPVARFTAVGRLRPAVRRGPADSRRCVRPSASGRHARWGRARPYLYVTGLGAGGRLQTAASFPPAQITDVEQFPPRHRDRRRCDRTTRRARLFPASVICDGGRGGGASGWAAGVRFTSVLVSCTRWPWAYASLDRGVEIGLVGVTRRGHSQPPDGPGSARSSSPRSSWRSRAPLLDRRGACCRSRPSSPTTPGCSGRDCQLTGGFRRSSVWFQPRPVRAHAGRLPPGVQPPRPRSSRSCRASGFHWAVQRRRGHQGRGRISR